MVKIPEVFLAFAAVKFYVEEQLLRSKNELLKTEISDAIRVLSQFFMENELRAEMRKDINQLKELISLDD